MKYQEKIFDVITQETTFRDFDETEIAELEAAKAEAETKVAELVAKQAARQALLDRLGITAEEAQLLLGSN